MNQPRDPDPIIATWLDDGPIDLPDETRRAIVGRPANAASRSADGDPERIVHVSDQSPRRRGGHRARRRRPVRPSSSPIAAAAPAAHAASPSPSASPPPSRRRPRRVAPSASPVSTAGWVPFTSTHYGYPIAYPPTERRDAGDARLGPRHRSADAACRREAPPMSSSVARTETETAVIGFAADVPAGTSEDAWLTSYYAGGAFCPTMPTSCPSPSMVTPAGSTRALTHRRSSSSDIASTSSWSIGRKSNRSSGRSCRPSGSRRAHRPVRQVLDQAEPQSGNASGPRSASSEASRVAERFAIGRLHTR